MFLCYWSVFINVVPSRAANCFMWDQLHKETCTERRRKRFQGYSRFDASSCWRYLFRFCIIAFSFDFWYQNVKWDSVKLRWASEKILLVLICCDVVFYPSLFRFCMPTRESAERRRTWRRSLRATRPTVSHTKATSSSPRYITSPPTARPAQSLCGTSSSRRRPWSVAAATSSATRTTSTKRRMLLLLAKVESCLWSRLLEWTLKLHLGAAVAQ